MPVNAVHRCLPKPRNLTPVLVNEDNPLVIARGSGANQQRITLTSASNGRFRFDVEGDIANWAPADGDFYLPKGSLIYQDAVGDYIFDIPEKAMNYDLFFRVDVERNRIAQIMLGAAPFPNCSETV